MGKLAVSPEGPPTTKRVFVTADPDVAPNIGDLLVLEYKGRKKDEEEHSYQVLGIVTNTFVVDRVLSNAPKILAEHRSGEHFYVSSVYLLGEIVKRGNEWILEPVVLAPPVGAATKIRYASEEDLKKIFGESKENVNMIKIGKALNVNFDVYVSLKEIATKHLAILAVTGAGKSNTVAHLIREIIGDAQRSIRILPVVVFDLHGEYDLNIPKGTEIYRREEPTFDPFEADADDLMPLFNVPENAYIERMVMSEAFETAKRFAELVEEKYTVEKMRIRGKRFLLALLGVLYAILTDAYGSYQRNISKRAPRLKAVILRSLRNAIRYLGLEEKNILDALIPYALTIAKLSSEYTLGADENGDSIEMCLGKIVKNNILGGISGFSCRNSPSQESIYAVANELIRMYDPRDFFVGTWSMDIKEALNAINGTIQEIYKAFDPPGILTKDPSEEVTRTISLIRKTLNFIKEFGDLVESKDPIMERLRNVRESGRSGVFVVDLSRLPKEKADVIVSIYMRKIFNKARDAFKKSSRPTVQALIILEEAHNFIGSEEGTYTKPIAEKIMREGRKYGVGMIVVSQRPRRLDSNIMSQVNNYIILKIVHPEDQAYVRELTEQLPEELAGQLSNLRTGEALLIGPFIKLPIIVKVESAEGFKKRGMTPDIEPANKNIWHNPFE